MKKSLLAIGLSFLSLGLLKAQEDMTIEWESKVPHKIIQSGTAQESNGKYSYVSDMKSLSVFLNKDGKMIWTKAFKEIAPKLRKIDEIVPVWDSECIFVFERKMGKDQVAVIDLRTGKALWSSQKYQKLGGDNIVYLPERDGFFLCLKESMIFVNRETGEERWETTKFKGVVGKYHYDAEENSITMVNFKPDGLAALFSGFKNQIIKVNTETGDIIWEQVYRGRAERKVITKEFLFDIRVARGKVFLTVNGVQVYDYKTGAAQWNAYYDYTPQAYVSKPNSCAGCPKTIMGVYGAVAKPLVDGEDLYILEMSNKKNQRIKKYDLKSGRLLWTSPEIPDAKVLPNMYLIDGIIVLQAGGVVEAQAIYYTKDSQGAMTTNYRIWYPSVKPFGVQGYNAETGAMVWQSEKMKKGITNILDIDNHVYVCSGKALYKMDYKTGKQEYEVDVKGDGVGLAVQILAYKDMIAVVGEKGITTHDAASGKLKNASKYKKSDMIEQFDNYVLMRTPKADIACFDLNTCTYKQFNAKKGARSLMSLDGKFVYVFEKKMITKLQTK